jgi:hypothetical protein
MVVQRRFDASRGSHLSDGRSVELHAFARLPVGSCQQGPRRGSLGRSSDDERRRYTTKPKNGGGRETYDRGVVEAGARYTWCAVSRYFRNLNNPEGL